MAKRRERTPEEQAGLVDGLKAAHRSILRAMYRYTPDSGSRNALAGAAYDVNRRLEAERRRLPKGPIE